MTGLEALQSAQFITVEGQRLVVINLEDWEALIDWLETLEDTQIAKQTLAELRKSGHNRGQAGWLKWDDVKEELE